MPRRQLKRIFTQMTKYCFRGMMKVQRDKENLFPYLHLAGQKL